MLNKKGAMPGMPHSWSKTDLFILLGGVVIGLVLIYYLRDSSFVQGFICQVA